ncbi:PaaX family transcriptional regulator C-terminal domain-containing protein [Pseudoprimorskyibacter insulae]|uniref:Transcriptional repressor PaaX n=1 Tax=Pseudoprimorskyibacter insulae TaxID=1695997 RepID=A0A2R8AZ61_9RHOB|nr:PaaX family transcriptional regulator C-terminal domain-containing protein [Pseudoprimorskyibacter insulae]SPF81332.1 Transcriptional repressor PaaX [Pseudoprimorskyibacter insulae]
MAVTLETIVQDAQTCGPLKAWSVIVTVLGDLLPNAQARISGGALGQILEPLGISNQTLRVALHRLKRDGWVTSFKDGRQSFYGLTSRGWDMSQAVVPLVYGPHTQAQVWLAIAPPTLQAAEVQDIAPDDALQISPRCMVIGEAPGAALADWLTSPLQPGQTPGWVRDAVANTDHRAAYRALAQLATQAKGIAVQPLFLRTTLRILAFHHWRRMRLRDGYLADALMPERWEGAQARDAVMALLADYPRPDLAELESARS